MLALWVCSLLFSLIKDISKHIWSMFTRHNSGRNTRIQNSKFCELVNLPRPFLHGLLPFVSGPNKHQSAVTCLQFSKKFVITSSDDGTVKIWDLKTGEFLRNLVSLDSGGSGGVVWRLRCNNTKLVCAVGSRNGTEETKLMVLDFDVEDKKVS